MSLSVLAKAGLIGMLLEGIMYGIYLIVSLQTLRILCKKAVPGFVFMYLASTGFMLFVLITLTMGVDIQITMKLFFSGNDAPPIEISIKLARLRYGIYVSLTMIADIFMVYRVFAVWSRSLVASAIPCLLSIAGIICGGLLAANYSDLAFRTPEATGLLTAFYCITLLLNLLCTALIAIKLYISERETELSSSLRLRWTSVVVIESAALYLTCIIVVVVCNVVRADSVHLVALITAPSIVGLTFSSIVIRIASSDRSSSKTFTSIDISWGSVLHFAGRPRTVDEAEIGIDACGSDDQSSKKATVVPITAVAASHVTIDDVGN
ncbi:hypothetical protein AAF712_004903 [Marasmius tenuissimus]|uniref:Uncharacterized protein n=1 Tax=Marasmius tenuissimus TaxID=585030 RepID=A0ABR3A3D5_9AGAR